MQSVVSQQKTLYGIEPLGSSIQGLPSDIKVKTHSTSVARLL